MLHGLFTFVASALSLDRELKEGGRLAATVSQPGGSVRRTAAASPGDARWIARSDAHMLLPCSDLRPCIRSARRRDVSAETEATKRPRMNELDSW
jgi:hypothetical protein